MRSCFIMLYATLLLFLSVVSPSLAFAPTFLAPASTPPAPIEDNNETLAAVQQDGELEDVSDAPALLAPDEPIVLDPSDAPALLAPDEPIVLNSSDAPAPIVPDDDDDLTAAVPGPADVDGGDGPAPGGPVQQPCGVGLPP